ncbi:hypothetical protein DL96DRAFT_1821683 [Flagelloscypha sp. PMI_526]|nr:hypothetical protein DL96DRAFT_1821683 [Flagelloscypha sp. PMI_526]
MPNRSQSAIPLSGNISSGNLSKHSSTSQVNNELSSHRRIWHILAVLIHLILVFVHLVLALVMVFGLEKRIHIGLNVTPFWTTVTQITLQTVAIVLLAACLFVCQTLFMQRLLALKQSLTRSHDQYSAWLGIGNAVLTLYKQRTAHSGLRSVSMIALYLGGSATLKITIPALFQFPVHTTTILTPSTATSIHPYPILSSDFRKDFRHQLMEIIGLEQGPSGNGSSIPNRYSSIGLHGNILYDIIEPVANATGLVEVNTCAVSVQCHSFDTALMRNDPSHPFYKRLFTNGVITISDTTIYMDGRINGEGMSQGSGGSSMTSVYQNVVFPLVSFLNITDSQGNQSTRVPVEDLFFAIGKAWGIVSLFQSQDLTKCKNVNFGNFYPVRAAELGLCSVEYQLEKAPVDAKSRVLINLPRRKVTSKWTEHPVTNWSNWKSSLFLDAGRDEFRVRQKFPIDFLCDGTLMDDPLAFWQTYVLKRMGFINALNPQSNDTIKLPSFQLHDFEKAMEDFIALYIFSGQLAVVNEAAETSNQITVLVPTSVLESQLTLSELPVYAGLVAAVIIFGVVLWITFTTPGYSSHLDNCGVLQLLWLSNTYLGSVPRPTENKLRRAGLGMQVQLKDGLAVSKREA